MASQYDPGCCKFCGAPELSHGTYPDGEDWECPNCGFCEEVNLTAQVIDLDVPQEESEPLPFSEPPLDEEDTLQMTPVTAAPQELPEEIQKVIGYLQQLIEDLEAGKRDTGSGLSIGQDQTFLEALSWVVYDESHENGEQEDEDGEDQFWYDDYPDKVCTYHGQAYHYKPDGTAICGYCGEKI